MSAYVWTPEAEARVMGALASGRTQQSIADEVGCGLANINEVKRRVELRNLNANPLTVKLTDDDRRAKRAQLRILLRTALGIDYREAAEEVIASSWFFVKCPKKSK
jgi:transcriptional regulator